MTDLSNLDYRRKDAVLKYYSRIDYSGMNNSRMNSGIMDCHMICQQN